MQKELKEVILNIMDNHRIMTIATVRSDDYPHATTVGFTHDGLVLYFVCGSNSQKARNIDQNAKVSITIDQDHEDLLHIKGISLAGTASRITDANEVDNIHELFAERYPEMKTMPTPEPGSIAVFKVEPEVISILDYSKGFGHTDLVKVQEGDIHPPHETIKHIWNFLKRKSA